jgi:cell division inhibitor SepF
MGAFLGLVPEDEERAGESYGDGFAEPDYSSGYERPYPRYQAREDGRGGHVEHGAEPVTHGSLAVQLQPEGRPAPESTSAARPLTVKLTGFAEARIIGERYRDGASVILDMTDLSDADARRVVDFAAGLAFALRGSIDKVTTRVFMLLPPHADLSAEDRRAFAGSFGAR